MDFLEKAIEYAKDSFNKRATIYALIAVAQELRLIRQQFGHLLQGQKQWMKPGK